MRGEECVPRVIVRPVKLGRWLQGSGREVPLTGGMEGGGARARGLSFKAVVSAAAFLARLAARLRADWDIRWGREGE